MFKNACYLLGNTFLRHITWIAWCEIKEDLIFIIQFFVSLVIYTDTVIPEGNLFS